MTASKNVVELMYVSYPKRLDRAELHSQGIIITIKVVNVRNLRGADVEEMRIISRRCQNVNMNVIIMENAVLPILVNQNISKAAPRKVIKQCEKKQDKKSGDNICQWISCGDVGYCEWDGVNGKKRSSKKKCAAKLSKGECESNNNCVWQSGYPTSEYMEDLDSLEMSNNNNKNDDDELEMDISDHIRSIRKYEVLAKGMDVHSGDGDEGFGSYALIITAVIVLGIIMFIVYKRYRLRKEVNMMNDPPPSTETDALLL